VLRRLAGTVVSHPAVVLAATLSFIVVAVLLGGGVADHLKVGGFEAPGSPSARAQKLLDERFGGSPNLVLQATARQGSVDDEAVGAAAGGLTARLASEPRVAVVGSYWPSGAPELRSKDRRSGLILLRISGSTEQRADTARAVVDQLRANDPTIVVRAGGALGITNEIDTRVNDDLVRSESIALPLTLFLLVVVFGGVVAGMMPLVIAVVSIVSTWLLLLGLSKLTDVSVYALTVATAFGLGLAIDFGLLMVSRCREERNGGRSSRDAVVEAVATAGETILFSAATVSVAMASLLVFPIYFLRSVGMAAIVVVLVAATGAVVVLPAVLALAGDRIDSLVIFGRGTAVGADSPFWRRTATAAIHHPARLALPVVGVLILLSIPFLHARFAPADERALPRGSPARQVSTGLHTNYPTDSTRAISIVAAGGATDLAPLAARISRRRDVIVVDGAFGRYARGQRVAEASPNSAQFVSGNARYLTVLPSVATESDAAQHLVRSIRSDPAVERDRLLVGGATASQIDFRSAISGRLGLALAIVAIAMFVLLFVFTRSIVVPLKAMMLNMLALGAVLGATVWVFQDGHLVQHIGVTPAPLNLAMVVLLCTIVFGLSVDYEIFLLSRIIEARDRGLNTTDATIDGLARVGRIVTAAAALLTVTLFSFSIGLSFMKMFGIATGLAILLDATLIRGVLVPAFMGVAGDLNWWAPRPLLRMLPATSRSRAPVAPTASVVDGTVDVAFAGLAPPGTAPASMDRALPLVPAAFVVVNPGTDGESLVPIEDRLYVGRECVGIDERHRLVVSDPKVSRDHLVVRVDKQSGRAWVVDTSRYGTLLNGQPLERTASVPLHPGDRLHLGTSTLEFRSDRPPDRRE
jgi:RND superfamily putative drug exporter